MRLPTPRLDVAGLSGDSGKTLVSLGLARALWTRAAVAPLQEGSRLHRCRLAGPGRRVRRAGTSIPF